MAKCDICGEKIETHFLGKLKGTIVFDSKHKKKMVCPRCQKENKDLKAHFA